MILILELNPDHNSFKKNVVRNNFNIFDVVGYLRHPWDHMPHSRMIGIDSGILEKRSSAPALIYVKCVKFAHALCDKLLFETKFTIQSQKNPPKVKVSHTKFAL